MIEFNNFFHLLILILINYITNSFNFDFNLFKIVDFLSILLHCKFNLIICFKSKFSNIFISDILLLYKYNFFNFSKFTFLIHLYLIFDYNLNLKFLIFLNLFFLKHLYFLYDFHLNLILLNFLNLIFLVHLYFVTN